MRSSTLCSFVLAVALSASVSDNAFSQSMSHPPESPRQVVVSASASVEVTPDRARLVIAVETRGQTSVAAATENARIQTAVLEAVRRAGVASAQIRTLAVTVNPEYQYPADGGRPTVVGYQARNTIQVAIHDLSKVAAVIDGALGRGATNIQGPTFYVEDVDGVRREALQQAVRKAMLEASSIAQAAGVSLGAVLEISASEGGRGDVPQYAMARMTDSNAQAPTPIEAGTTSITASVTIRIEIAVR